MTLPDIPNFAFVFKFDQRVSALESEMSELKQTNQLTEAVSSIMGIADKYLASKMKEAVVVAVQLQTNKLKEEAQAENQEFRKRSLQAPPKTLPNHNISLPARDNDEQPADKEVTKADWFKKPERPPTPDLDWSKRHQVDFQPTQTWISQAALAEEPPTSFDEFNDTSFDFSAFAATYELKWIEDLVHELWSPVVAKYDQHAYLGTSHWGPKRQRLYGYARNLTSSKDVYSRRRIIAVSRLRIMKSVESYQKKLNLTKPDTYRSNLKNKTAYTSHSDPHEIIYMDQLKRKRLMHTDKLYKFSDGTLNDVRTALHDIVAGIRMKYTLMRK
nr:hypothetical protein [Tanacetum cinerariifolium]